MDSEAHQKWMRRALELARAGEGKVNPYPLVGAVLVEGGKVIAEGGYKESGGRHAEAAAVDKAGKAAEGADLYVNLEPCVGFPGKRTLPCADRIIESGVKRVFVGMEDPNPKVNGGGVEKLKEAGIEVELGVLEEEARKLNEIYTKYMTTKRPFVLLKMAMTADGKIATRTGDSRWISSQESRRLVHQLRNRFSAVLVGVGTVLKDDPSLTARLVEGRNPARIVLDSEGRTPLNSRVLDGKGRTIIVSTDKIPDGNEGRLKKKGAEVWKLGTEGVRIDLDKLVGGLGEKGIDSIMVEGGGETAWGFLKAGLVDKLMLFIAPKIIGGKDSKTPVEGGGIDKIEEAIRLKNVSVRKIGDDVLYEGYLSR